jgi:signal transduction histidine kinase
MNPSKKINTIPLRKVLFYRGQIYFQILAVVALVVGTIILKWIFSYYQVPEYLFKIILLFGFALTILVMGLQAYLHHLIVAEGLSPVSWLTQELRSVLEKMNLHKNEEAADILALEKEMEEFVKTLGHHKEKQQELKDLVQTLNHLLSLLKNYWQSATRNEVLAAIGQVSAEVAHDLKGPLFSLKVAAAYFQKAPGSASWAT